MAGEEGDHREARPSWRRDDRPRCKNQGDAGVREAAGGKVCSYQQDDTISIDYKRGGRQVKYSNT